MKIELKHRMSCALITFMTLMIFTTSLTHLAEAAPSLSLTIWGAELPADGDGRKWDLNSAPDVFVRVSLGDRFLRQSEVQRDETKPLWALTIGPLSEKRFYEGALIVQVVDQDLWGEEVIEEFQLATPTQDQLGKMIEARGTHVSSLSYQWGLVQRDIWRSRRGRGQQSDAARELGGKLEDGLEGVAKRGVERRDTRERVRKNTDERVKDLASPDPTSMSSTERGVTSSEDLPPPDRAREERQLINRARQQSARRAARASRLYKIYLRAQFEGDQLEAHRVLIKLAQHYPYTRHGRKAQRLLLLDGR